MIKHKIRQQNYLLLDNNIKNGKIREKKYIKISKIQEIKIEKMWLRYQWLR